MNAATMEVLSVFMELLLLIYIVQIGHYLLHRRYCIPKHKNLLICVKKTSLDNANIIMLLYVSSSVEVPLAVIRENGGVMR